MIVEAEHLNFAYGDVPVLRDCSLTIEDGEFLALAGPNGAGKSTLFALLTRCHQPQSGELRLFGRHAGSWAPPELARRQAVLPQQDHAPPQLTAFEMALLGRSPYLRGFLRFESAKDRAIAREALATVGMEELANRPIGTLSGGERRLVMLARALAQQPDFLLLDEPAASLDLHHQQTIFRLLKQLHHERGTTILAVIHDLNLAAVFCSRLLLLHGGQIAADGEPGALMSEETVRRVYSAEVWSGTRPDGRPVLGLLP